MQTFNKSNIYSFLNYLKVFNFLFDLFQNKADITLKNRDGQSPLSLAIQLDDEDLIDILKGDQSLLDYVKKGNLQRVKKLLNETNKNSRDVSGRHSSGLHLAAGYNHLDIAEYFLQMNANAEIKDKGGLICLHNAASYGHVEMAALLLKYQPQIINIQDKWGYTALHEASQKSRTQMCALLLEHGADLTIKNLDGRTALDLATADDVRALLENAIPRPLSSTNNKSVIRHVEPSQFSNRDTEQPIIAGAMQNVKEESTLTTRDRSSFSSIQTPSESGDGCMDLNSEHKRNQYNIGSMTILEFLYRIDESYVELYGDLFEKEQISMEILAEMSHDQLKEIGLNAYGVRHKILKGIEKLYKTVLDPFFNVPLTGSLILDLDPNDTEYEMVKNEMLTSIRTHKDDGNIVFQYELLNIKKIKNRKLWSRYLHRKKEIQEENCGHENERLLFHGSPFLTNIVEKGFDERHA